MRLTDADKERMNFIENEIAKTVGPFRENTEAMIVVFALVRVARTLLMLYSKKTRDLMLEDVVVPFLRKQDHPGRMIDTGTLIKNTTVQ